MSHRSLSSPLPLSPFCTIALFPTVIESAFSSFLRLFAMTGRGADAEMDSDAIGNLHRGCNIEGEVMENAGSMEQKMELMMRSMSAVKTEVTGLKISLSEKVQELQCAVEETVLTRTDLRDIQKKLETVSSDLHKLKSNMQTSNFDNPTALVVSPLHGIVAGRSLTQAQKKTRYDEIWTTLGGRNAMVCYAQCTVSAIVMSIALQLPQFSFLMNSRLEQALYLAENDDGRASDVLLGDGVSVFGAMQCGLTKNKNVRETSMGKMISFLHRTTVIRSINSAYYVNILSGRFAWLKCFHSPEITKFAVASHYDVREKSQTSNEPSPGRSRKRQRIEDSTGMKTAQKMVIDDAKSILADFVGALNMRFKGSRFQTRMTLHRRLTFMIDLIEEVGGVEKAAERGVEVIFDNGHDDPQSPVEGAGGLQNNVWNIPENFTAACEELRNRDPNNVSAEIQQKNADLLDSVRDTFNNLIVTFKYPRTVQKGVRTARPSPTSSRSFYVFSATATDTDTAHALCSTSTRLPGTVVEEGPSSVSRHISISRGERTEQCAGDVGNNTAGERGERDDRAYRDGLQGQREQGEIYVSSTLINGSRYRAVRMKSGHVVRYVPVAYRPEWNNVFEVSSTPHQPIVLKERLILPFCKCSITRVIRSTEEAPFLWPHVQKVHLVDLAAFLLSEVCTLTVPVWLASSSWCLQAAVFLASGLHGLLKRHLVGDMDDLSAIALGNVVNGYVVGHPSVIGTMKKSDQGTSDMDVSLIDLLTMSYSAYEEAFHRNVESPIRSNVPVLQMPEDPEQQREWFSRYACI